MPITILADTLVTYTTNMSEQELYIDAFKWCVRRFVSFLEDKGSEQGSGPNWVVLDEPPEPSKKRLSLHPRLKKLYADRSMAPHKNFQELYWNTESFNNGKSADPYRSQSLSPTLATSHARYSDALQIADFIAGCVSECIDHLISTKQKPNTGKPQIYKEDNLSIIGGLIRKGPNDQLKGYGYDLFPKDMINNFDSVIKTFESLCGKQ